MLSIVVLGTAAGGGLPQWNCGCDNCRAVRQTHRHMRASQASIAVSADRIHWFLINASPDLRQQIADTPCLYPREGALRHSPIAGVILSNGEVDAIAGLLTLREGTPFALYAHERVLGLLEANSIFNVLRGDMVARRAIALDCPFSPQLVDGKPSGLEIVPFAAPGKAALFIEDETDNTAGDTLGLEIRDTETGRSIVFLAACAAVTREVEARLAQAKMVFFDGTLWRDTELIDAGLGTKTGQRMGHMTMPDAIAALSPFDIERKFFLHINNSNPALCPTSTERQTLEAAGWRIPSEGEEITL